jgi:hypothetical protein
VKQVGGLVLIDGTRLANVRFIKPYLSFCTLAGIQTIDLNHCHVRLANGQMTGLAPQSVHPTDLALMAASQRWHNCLA